MTRFLITIIIANFFLASCNPDEETLDLNINEVIPEVAFPLDTINIIGSNFGTDIDLLSVFIDGVSSNVLLSNEDTIEVIVPEGVLKGDLEIKREGLNSGVYNFDLLLPKIDVVGFIDSERWDMKFGRTFGPNFGSYSKDAISVALYSTSWSSDIDVCEINSYVHGYMAFQVPRETGTYTKIAGGSFTSEEYFTFQIVTESTESPGTYNFKTLTNGTAIINIQSIQEDVIYGNLEVTAENSSVSGNFIINICE